VAILSLFGYFGYFRDNIETLGAGGTQIHMSFSTYLMSNIDPDWPVWANPLIWDLRSCGRCKRHVILGGTAAGLARPASEMAILGVLEAILGDFRVIMANLRVKYTQLPMCISVCTASMGTGERNGVFWCILVYFGQYGQ